MSPKDFVSKYLPFAKQAQRSTGIHAVAILAQAALESGWGERAPGNMFFGIKDPKKGKTGKGQLLVTTEYLKSPDQHKLFPEVLSVTWNEPRKRWKYLVRDWFKKYDTPAASFREHARFFGQNPRYAEAIKHRKDPVRFLEEVAKAGYATAPDYAAVLTKLVEMIKRNLPQSSPATTGSNKKSAAAPEPVFEIPEARIWAYLGQRDALEDAG